MNVTGMRTLEFFVEKLIAPVIIRETEDKQRIDELSQFLSQVLSELTVSHSQDEIRKTVIREYDLAFQFNHDAPDNFSTYRIPSEEKNDPVNLIPVITNVLARFGVKTELSQIYNPLALKVHSIAILRKLDELTLSTQCLAFVHKFSDSLQFASVARGDTKLSAQDFTMRYLGLCLNLIVIEGGGTQSDEKKGEEQILNRLFQVLVVLTLSLLLAIPVGRLLSGGIWISIPLLSLLMIKAIGVCLSFNLNVQR